MGGALFPGLQGSPGGDEEKRRLELQRRINAALSGRQAASQARGGGAAPQPLAPVASAAPSPQLGSVQTGGQLQSIQPGMLGREAQSGKQNVIESQMKELKSAAFQKLDIDGKGLIGGLLATYLGLDK